MLRLLDAYGSSHQPRQSNSSWESVAQAQPLTFQVTLVPQTGSYSKIDLTDAAAPGGGARSARPTSNNVS
jgi:hypothetical protein